MSLQTDTKYAGVIASRLERFKLKKPHPYLANFRCPFCGDSQKNKFKARGFLLTNKDRLVFKCHNCQFSCGMAALLEKVDPSNYRLYCIETFGDRGRSNSESFFIPSTRSSVGNSHHDDLSKFIDKVSTLASAHPARKYLDARKLPEERYDDLFYSKNMKEDLKLMVPYKYLDRMFDDERVVIPFRDAQGKLTGFTGRALDPNAKSRYATVCMHEDVDLIYGLDRVDWRKQVWVTEGQFDSMFVDNAIAPGGTDFARALKPGMIIIFDNQPRNRQVVLTLEKFSKKGYAMVVWPKSWIYKDINESIIDGVTRSEVMEILNKSTYRDLALTLAINEWKR